MSADLLPHALHFGKQVASMCVWLILLALVFVPLEHLFSLQPRELRRKELPRDLAYYFMNNLLPTAIMAAPLALLAAALNRVTPQAYTEVIASLPLWVRIIAALVVAEVGSYWGHRWSHETPFLWRFHAVHHAPEHIDWLVNPRAHPLDMVFTRLCGLTPLYALGLANAGTNAGTVPLIVSLVGTVWSFFIHANVRWRFGPLEQLISTPAFHNWHHTNDEHRDHNYAALMPFVDRLFGTFHLPNHWPPHYGIDEPPARTMVGQLLDPFARHSPAQPEPQSPKP
jgi:sterol desaturase/sphingolipid hydroxylase (fatty acid hydroxylase superfamily)